MVEEWGCLPEMIWSELLTHGQTFNCSPKWLEQDWNERVWPARDLLNSSCVQKVLRRFIQIMLNTLLIMFTVCYTIHPSAHKIWGRKTRSLVRCWSKNHFLVQQYRPLQDWESVKGTVENFKISIWQYGKNNKWYSGTNQGPRSLVTDDRSHPHTLLDSFTVVVDV